MKIGLWLSILFIGLSGCTRSAPDPALNGDAVAVLNEQIWGGISTTWKNDATSDTCGVNTVNLTIQNKLPYPKARLQAPAFCTGYCGDQRLTFLGIPLAVGVYSLTAHRPCSACTNQVGVSFMTLVGGDVLLDQYQPDSTSTGTISITRYDPQLGEIDGTFDITFVRDPSRKATTDAAETLNFRNGSFRTSLR